MLLIETNLPIILRYKYYVIHFILILLITKNNNWYPPTHLLNFTLKRSCVDNLNGSCLTSVLFLCRPPFCSKINFYFFLTDGDWMGGTNDILSGDSYSRTQSSLNYTLSPQKQCPHSGPRHTRHCSSNNRQAHTQLLYYTWIDWYD